LEAEANDSDRKDGLQGVRVSSGARDERRHVDQHKQELEAKGKKDVQLDFALVLFPKLVDEGDHKLGVIDLFGRP